MAGQDHRQPKKTDHIQIRPSSETKKEFLDACREDRVSASDVLRRAIGDYLARRKRPAGTGALEMVPRPLRRRRYLAIGAAGIGLTLLATMPSAADPDFAAAFKRMDRNGDGVLSQDEFTLRGPDGARYATPVGRYATADGFGIEVWEWPLGARTVSMAPKGARWLDPRYDVLRTGPDPSSLVWRILSDRNQDGKVDASEFEAFLRSHAQKMFAEADTNGDAALSDDEIAAMAHADGPRPPSFESGPGGDAMRTKRAEIVSAVFQSFDINGDHKVTLDEALERWLARFVGAYAPEQ